MAHNSFICHSRCVQRCNGGTLGPHSIPHLEKNKSHSIIASSTVIPVAERHLTCNKDSRQLDLWVIKKKKPTLWITDSVYALAINLAERGDKLITKKKNQIYICLLHCLQAWPSDATLHGMLIFLSCKSKLTDDYHFQNEVHIQLTKLKAVSELLCWLVLCWSLHACCLIAETYHKHCHNWCPYTKKARHPRNKTLYPCFLMTQNEILEAYRNTTLSH